MKRALLLALVIVGLGGAVVQAQDVDNFVINQYDVQLQLGRDDERRSTLTTTETITATFPDYDQNHGLERIMVREYDGHTTNLQLVSVTDARGEELEYHWVGDALRIGDPDEYVHGQQTYVISYTQRDVTTYYEDTDREEFYWDAIGVEWRVPIEQASVRLQVAEPLQPEVNSQLQCYRGASGSDAFCQTDAQDGAYQVAVSELPPQAGVTIAVGFSPGTFVEYQPTFLEKVQPYIVGSQVVGGLLMGPILGWLGYRYKRDKDRRKELTTIIPEYLPPDDLSVTAAAHLVDKSQNVMAAQLIDLAVRGYIDLHQVKDKTWWRAAQYEIEIKQDVGLLRPEEKELLSDSFGSLPSVGDRLNLKTLKNNTSFQRRLQDNDRKLKQLIREQYGLREQSEDMRRQLRRTARRLGGLGAISLSAPVLGAAGVAYGMSTQAWQLTDRGLDAKRYLLGLKDYIELAEKDRLEFLQSPDGALKQPSDEQDAAKQRVELYEKALPFAMLFGQTKQWNEHLGEYYQQANTEPTWYHGAHGFSSSNFGSDISNFAGAARSASAASSSSGGSSGGGSAGGGGGGGGGGGW